MLRSAHASYDNKDDALYVWFNFSKDKVVDAEKKVKNNSVRLGQSGALIRSGMVQLALHEVSSSSVKVEPASLISVENPPSSIKISEVIFSVMMLSIFFRLQGFGMWLIT